MNKKREESFTAGVVLLTASALIVKLIGVCYKIPLVNLLGAQGMGYFNAAYDVYALLCVISTTGLPVAVSILMSNHENVHRRIFRLSLIVFAFVGTLGSAAVFFMADHIAQWIKAPLAAQSLRFIAPAVLFVCLSGAFRGYYQGKRNMLPTAISQVIEAAGKLLFGLVFAYAAIQYKQNAATAAAFAVLGLSVGTLLCLLYLLLCNKSDKARPNGKEITTKQLFVQLLAVAFPVTLGAVLSGLSKMIDLALIMRRLQDSGIAQETAVAMYGCYTSMVIPLYSAIPALFGSLSMPLVSHLSHAINQKNQAEQTRILNTTFCLSAVIAIPSALGMGMLSDQIMLLLFRNAPELKSAVPLLIVMSAAIPASCLITATNAILQAYGHPWIPMISTAIGCIVKAIVLYGLTVMPRVGIMAAPISTLVCCMTIVLINLVYIMKCTPTFRFIAPWTYACAISIVSIGSAAVVKRMAAEKISSVSIVVLLTVALAVMLYALLAFKTGLLQQILPEKSKTKKDI